MTLATALLASALASAPRQDEISIESEIAALIERTNAIHTLHLVLSTPESDGGEGSARLELAYRAPWDARLILVYPGRRIDVHLDLEFQTQLEEDEEERWIARRLVPSELRARLDELFPAQQALGPGAVFDMRARSPVPGARLGGSLFPEQSARDTPFRWLGAMHDDPGSVARDERHLRWTDGALELRISRKTGLPEELRATPGERELVLTLVSCRTDVDADDPELAALLARPEAEPAPEDDIPQILFLYEGSFERLRPVAFERVEGALRSGARSWSEETRSDWDDIFAHLHGSRMLGRWHEWLTELRANLDEFAGWLDGLVEDATDEELDDVRRAALPAIETHADGLSSALAEAEELYVSELPELDDLDPTPRAELLEREREVIARVHAQFVALPLEERLAEVIAKFLGK